RRCDSPPRRAAPRRPLMTPQSQDDGPALATAEEPAQPKRRRSLWKRFRRATRGPRNAVLARAIWGVGRAVGALPPPVALALGRALGRGAHVLLGTPRQPARRHVGLAFPELDGDARARIVRATFEHAGESFVELGLWRLIARDPGYVLGNFEVLDAALAEGRGTIAITGHVGNWELLAATVAARGYGLSVVARRVNDARFDALITRFRGDRGMEILVRDAPDFLAQVLALRTRAPRRPPLLPPPP